MKIIGFGLLVLLSMSAMIKAQTKPRQAEWQSGVPRDLAMWRAAHYSKVRYKLRIDLERGAPLMQGEQEIRVTVSEPVDVVLDWRPAAAREGKPGARVWEMTINGKTAEAATVNEHLVIPANQVIRGENIIRLKFASPIATSGSAVTRYVDREDKSEYLYTLFVPSDASTAFPCFDQPDLKALYTLEAVAPVDWTVVSNTPVAEKTFPDGMMAGSGPGDRRARFLFQETKPISTYLFAFAAGPFEVIENPMASATDLSTRIYVRHSKAAQAHAEAGELFGLNRGCIAFLEDYFAFKYPFPKYDLVLIPEFAYGGMEHAGATFLREDRILFPTDPTANDKLTRVNVMFHEASHQWFGDLVTMKWFDDLWLKEGFAEFMSYQATAAVAPEFNAWKAFYERNKPLAYLTDSTKGTTAIWQDIPNLNSAKSAYGNIVYRKAPSFLRQAEFYLGKEKFRSAIRSFVRKHAFANAEWSDLVHEFEIVSGLNLDAWANTWVKRRGMPVITVTRANLPAVQREDLPNEFKQRITIDQTDALGEGGLWPMRLNVLLIYANGQHETKTIALDRSSTLLGIYSVAVEPNMRKLVNSPRLIFANYGDYGYGRFLLDADSRQYVLHHLADEPDDFLRALWWGSLWDSVREADFDPAEYLKLVIADVGHERDEVTVQSLLGRALTAFNFYLKDDARAMVAPDLEKTLYDQMLHAETVGLRITYFRAFVGAATTVGGREKLKQILKGQLQVPGMTLRSRDRFDLVTALMAQGDADAPALLAAEIKSNATDDERRYAYAAGAANDDATTKQKYFEAYLNDPSLAESWIESSVGAFNGIRQSALTASYLERALAELPTLKRTRKIFFVNGWLAAFIGGQCSEESLSVVNKFLGRNPDLDRDLRLKVLETVDGLERCVRIRRKGSAF